MHKAVIAFGSNLGDKVGYIENAVSCLRARNINIIKVSRLYETKPMYYEQQDSFLNGAILVATTLPPLKLLDTLQEIENEQGRKRGIDKGPRTLDLDIIYYNGVHVDDKRLQVPHPRLLEREFVLRPFADVLPEHQILTSAFNLSAPAMPPRVSVFDALSAVLKPEEPVYPVTTLSSQWTPIVPTLLKPDGTTRVMAIINLTPDSFSDGGQLNESDESAFNYAKCVIRQGATILDIGGQSTRPQATRISAEDELARILPALRAFKNIPEVVSGQVLVSLDTFYADVARACREEGLIDMVNDVSGGALDSNMLSTVAKLGLPVILMHMRGTPETMTEAWATDYRSYGGVIPGVARELVATVESALSAGILPWRIILDPGLGFAKTAAQSIELLRTGPTGLVAAEPSLAGYPWLVAPSRKGFIGKATRVKEAQERDDGTAACITTAIATGADIVRVHNVERMARASGMADAIYRSTFDRF